MSSMQADLQDKFLKKEKLRAPGWPSPWNIQLNFGSGHDVWVVGESPMTGSALGGTLLGILSLPLPLPLPLFMRSLARALK